MSDDTNLEPTLEDHKSAFTELSFLLEIFTRTIKDLVGGGTATVCRNAGRHMGRKLPIYLDPPTLPGAVAALVDHMKEGFEIQAQCPTPDEADLSFGRCPVRRVCSARAQDVGGDLCSMLHWYMGGILNEVIGRPVRSTIKSAGASRCTVHIEAS